MTGPVMGLPPIEPDAVMVQAALAMRGLHVALTRQGFTDDQAFQMVFMLLTKNTPQV